MSPFVPIDRQTDRQTVIQKDRKLHSFQTVTDEMI